MLTETMLLEVTFENKKKILYVNPGECNLDPTGALMVEHDDRVLDIYAAGTWSRVRRWFEEDDDA